MKMERTYEFKADAGTVWGVLLDPANLRECIPGCDRLEPVGDDEYEVTISLGIAAIGGTYHGTAKVRDKEEPLSYRLLVDGRGAPGFVTGDGLLTLETRDGTTTLRVAGNAEVGGKVAAVGQRMLTGIARHLMDRFFRCMQKRLPS